MKCSKCNHEFEDQLMACPLCGEPRHGESGTADRRPDDWAQPKTEQPKAEQPKTTPTATQYQSGYQTQQQPQTQQIDPSAKSNATAALVCGILGMVIPFVGIVLAIIAIVLGNSARKRLPEAERGMATAGWILGIIGLVIAVIVVIFFILAISFAAVASLAAYSSPYWYYY